MDVFSPEPIPYNHEILSFENVLLTPHIGTGTIECRKEMAEFAAKNIINNLKFWAMTNKYKEEFETIFKRVIGVSKVTPDMEMNNIAEWDSLKQVQLIAELEEKLGLEFEFEDIITMTSVVKIESVLMKFWH